MESIEEALEKLKSLNEELNVLIDKMLGINGENSTKQEHDQILTQCKEIYKQQSEIYAEINRLSNGSIHINKKGSKITFPQKKA